MTAHTTTPTPALLLDARRHAMLKAMGVELWWHPAPTAASVSAPVQQTAPDSASGSASVEAAPAPVHNAPHMPARLRTEQPIAVEKAAAPVSVPAPPTATTAPVAPKRPAVAVGEAILWRCGAASLVKPVEQLVEADTASNTSGQHWLFVTDDFSDLGEDAQAAEQLLQNMWRAMRLHRHPALWRSSMERVPPSAPSASSAEGKPGSGAPLALDDVLNNTLATAAPAVVVLMGRVAAQTLLQTTQPLGVLRQQPHRVAGVPAVATYSPSYLLRAGHAKAGAWADLQRALELARNVSPKA